MLWLSSSYIAPPGRPAAAVPAAGAAVRAARVAPPPGLHQPLGVHQLPEPHEGQHGHVPQEPAPLQHQQEPR